MTAPRRIPLFDPSCHPPTWNERMVSGEYAVHLSDFEDLSKETDPFCLVFNSLTDAEEYAAAEVKLRQGLRCRIYDRNGFIGAPIREFKGAMFRDNTDISPRFRRWGGGFLFFGGLLLFSIDAAFGYRWLWPSMLGSRMLMPGSILLVTELIVVLYARHHRRQAAGRAT